MVLLLWQWAVGVRFPLHWRFAETPFLPGVTLLKPVKGADEHTGACLRSWFQQDYAGQVQILIAAESESDPAFAIAKKLIAEYPKTDAKLVLAANPDAMNGKVAKLCALYGHASHDILVVSDSDVEAPRDLLAHLVQSLADPGVGLASCLYKVSDADTLPMKWEQVGVNVDFWSQVLQSNALQPMRFALGAVMALRREALDRAGGFQPLANHIADDYQLGRRVAQAGYTLVLSPVVVDCRSGRAGWRAIWRHQLRWARTIRVCQPAPYFFSIVSNATLWPLLLLLVDPALETGAFALVCWGVRMLAGLDLKRRIEWTGGRAAFDWPGAPVILLKDILQTAVWLLAFTGNKIEWRGRGMTLRGDGTIVRDPVGAREGAGLEVASGQR
jgi:ceramide glucosyltransferase